MPSSLSEDYPPTLPRPQVLLVTTRVVYTHKPSTVNNVASKKKNLYYKIFAVLFTLLTYKDLENPQKTGLKLVGVSEL